MPLAVPGDENIRLIRLETPDEIARWRAGFVGAYQTVFSDEPYFERITTAEADGVYRKLTSITGNITLLAVRTPHQVVAFGVAIPLRHKPDVARQLTGLVPVTNTYYLAELGVLHDFRNRHLGRTLVRARLRLIEQEHPMVTHVILRVPARKNATYDMYRAMGFEDMGVYMEVPAVRIDGRVTTDRRLFLCCVISQIRHKS